MIYAPSPMDAPRELPPIRRALETANEPVDIIIALQRALRRMTDAQRQKVNALVSPDTSLEVVLDRVRLLYQEVIDPEITPELLHELRTREP
jgi:hypothetical protein